MLESTDILARASIVLEDDLAGCGIELVLSSRTRRYPSQRQLYWTTFPVLSTIGWTHTSAWSISMVIATITPF